ncbi:Uncharacterized protein TCM_025507 [Theobroma cacao]|uniref:Uncharacterized protein n=1 Tax=Theobroma cacao TaxID=3641 RepID=A0A061EZP5_THECC|nr:Uncharacterized protein TCM_025507 [Theobroma cacao]
MFGGAAAVAVGGACAAGGAAAGGLGRPKAAAIMAGGFVECLDFPLCAWVIFMSAPCLCPCASCDNIVPMKGYL